MNANELADELKWLYDNFEVHTSMLEAATMLRQQAVHINNLLQWQKRHLDVIEAQKEYMKAQDEKIVDLAFKLVYAERGNEVAKELNNERK